MNLYLSHRSALMFWRAWSASRAISLRAFHDLRKTDGSLFPGRLYDATAALRTCASSDEDVRNLLCHVADSEVKAWMRACLEEEGAPVHVLVERGEGTRNSRKIVRHRSALVYPRGAFIGMAPHLFICSPELVFVQMAASLSFGELLALGYELCGCYPLDRPDGAALVRRPLTSPARLAAFCAQMEKARCVKVARVAARQVRAKSGSPMETELAIAAFTSVQRGGLGVEPAFLNAPIALSRAARRATGLNRVVGDFYWREARFLIEYDGREAHASEHRRAHDSRKHDALAMDGIELMTVTAPQFRNVTQSIALLDNAARRIGKPKRKRKQGHLQKHMALRAQARRYHRESLSQKDGGHGLGA
ncbi:hypothetical protein [Adlercreutzia mucosicola]|uniref:hypothetical protein n=1 Tax=Adlercreutzia mucosicola TaxID=580026 RepID=UPI002B2527A4|nr:hypothetical protein [Adlercreutzia mucosicola]MEB1814105.1 hypothetical protein [Adlercreutzia mucosicola]